MARVCFYTNESFAERNADGVVEYHVALVTEGVPGYVRIEVEHDDRQDLTEIMARCDRINGNLGHNASEVSDIVASSMRQGTAT
jgi:hypothetical protein